jgi:hypothetical protein
VSSRDEEGRAGIVELLRISEEEEARALRDELIQFLRSDECRAEVAAVIQKPLESLVSQALTSAHFIESVREQLADALTPMMRQTAIDAAREAFRNLDITIPEDERKKIRKTATDHVQSTFNTALQSGVKDQLPALGEEVRKLVRTQTEAAVKSGTKDAAANLGTSWIDPISNAVAAAVQTAVRQTLEARADGADARIVVTPPAPPAAVRSELSVATPPATPAGDEVKTSRLRKVMADFRTIPGTVKGVLVLLVLFCVLLVVYQCARGSGPTIVDGGGTVVPSSTDTTASQATETTTSHLPPLTPLYSKYRDVLNAQAANFPQAATLSAETFACIDRAIANATTGQTVLVPKLREHLGGCSELKAAPPRDSLVVAALQWQLATVLQECVAADQSVAIDGRKGPGTTTAFREYIGCKNPADLPSELNTLADYAAVTLVILRERPLEGGS